MDITPLDDWICAKTGARDAESLRAYQLEKFRETVDYVNKNSRFYREHLANIETDRIRSLDDISIIPFTTAKMIIDSPLDYVCVTPGDIERIVTLPTSGTTGPSKRIFFTQDDQELTIDFFRHGMSTLVGENDKVLIFLPGKTVGSVGDLLKRGLERLGCEGMIYGPIRDYVDALRVLSSGVCNCVVGLSAQIFALSRLGEGIKLKSVLLCSDFVPTAAVRAIGKEWDCEVFCHYGMTETGLGGGVECSAHMGYHMWENDFLFEIIDPVSGVPIRDGGCGELVFTTLQRRGMPLVRYRTDDISAVLAEPCPCGSRFRRFERISGRMSDFIQIKKSSGTFKLSMPMLDELLYVVPGLVGFSAKITSGEDHDVLAISVFAPDTTGAIGEVKERLQSDRYIGKNLSEGSLGLEVRQGGPEILTYGNTKRRIVRETRG